MVAGGDGQVQGLHDGVLSEGDHVDRPVCDPHDDRVARGEGRDAVGIARDADAIHDAQRAGIERRDQSTEIRHVDSGPRAFEANWTGKPPTAVPCRECGGLPSASRCTAPGEARPQRP